MQRWGIAAAAVLAVALGAGAAQAAPTWSVSDAVVSEGDAQVTFTITAANLGLFDSETVEYATVDGTATAPGDYTARHDTAPVFSAVGGTATATVNVPVSGDTTPEGDEILPVEYSDNYVTVFPGETVEIRGHLPNADQFPGWVRVTGQNTPATVVPIQRCGVVSMMSMPSHC